MVRNTLFALVATALWATQFSSAQAQATKPKATKQTKPTAAKPAAASEVIGSVNTTKITWEQVIAQLRAENPQALEQAVSMAAGAKVSTALFGPKPAAQVTVTKADVLQEMKKNPPPPVAQMLTMMLRNEALRQESTKLGVNPTNDDLDTYLNRMLDDARAQGQIPPEVTNEQVLVQRGLSRNKLRPQLRWQRQALNLIIKDMEKTQGRPYGPEDFLQARHILIMVKNAPPDAKEEDKKKLDEEALAKIKEIEEEIKSGKKTFEQAATESSEDGSKAKGGDLGPFVRGQMVKEFENAAFELKPGEMSAPVRSQFGYHLIKIEKTGAQLSPGERSSALDRLAQPKFGTYLAELMNNKYKVVNSLPQPPQPGGPGGLGAAPPRPGGPRPAPRPVGTNNGQPGSGSGN